MKSKKQIAEEVKKEICRLKPCVKELVSATNWYDETPNIHTGTRKNDAKERMFKTISDIAQNISHNWLNEYNKTITKDEMDEIFKEAFDSVTFDERDEYSSQRDEYDCYRNIMEISMIGEGI